MTSRAAFLHERLSGLGGSDIASLFNIAPYGCARKLGYDKTEVPPDYPVDEKPIMRRGNKLEPIIAEEYAEITGRTVTTRDMQRHPQHKWAIVHVDRLVSVDQGRFWDRVLEIKSVGREVFSKIKREGMAEAYILQVQHGMWVCGKDLGAFAAHNADAWKLLHWDVERDDEMIRMIQEAGDEFWAKLQEGELAPRLEPDSKQCQTCPWRTTCQGEALIDSVKSDGDIQFDLGMVDLVAELAEAREIYGEAEELFEAVKERVKAELGDRPAVEVPGYRVYFRPQTSMRLNEAKVKELMERWNALASSLKEFSDPRNPMEQPQKLNPIRIEDLKAPSVSRPLRLFAR